MALTRAALGTSIWVAKVAPRTLVDLRRRAKGALKCVFPLDGDLVLELDAPKFSHLFFGSGRRRIVKTSQFLETPFREPVLRSLVDVLFNSAYLDPSKDILDVGSWIGDNSVPWSKSLTECAKVIAIDPSRQNLSFAENICARNKITNVQHVQAICSENSGDQFSPLYDLDHSSFVKVRSSYLRQSIESVSCDDIVLAHGSGGGIGLLHIDAEGMEKNVLLGSQKLIEKDRPAVIFEFHKNDGGFRFFRDFFSRADYFLFEINEQAGARPDARNFIAFDGKRAMPDFDALELGVLRKLIRGGLWSHTSQQPTRFFTLIP